MTRNGTLEIDSKQDRFGKTFVAVTVGNATVRSEAYSAQSAWQEAYTLARFYAARNGQGDCFFCIVPHRTTRHDKGWRRLPATKRRRMKAIRRANP